MRIGFVVASHEGDGKLERLCGALNRYYDFPTIAVHHDFGQSAIDRSEFGSNVHFVDPHTRTAWAAWGSVEGMLRALRLLVEKQPCDWFFFLSASCYPVKTRDYVERELSSLNCNALVDFYELEDRSETRAQVIGDKNPKLSHFESPANKLLKWRFYKARQFWVPIIRRKPRLRVGKFTWRPKWEARNPYDEIGCFYGDFWFAGDARIAALLTKPTEQHLRLQGYLRNRTQPDESYVQTVLLNEPGLAICRDNRRFAEWNGGGRSPMNLTEAQLNECLSSNAFFARKFAPGTEVTKKIDEHLLG